MKLTIRLRAPDLQGLKPAVQRAIEAWVPGAAIYTREAMRQQILQRTQTVGRTGFLRNSTSLTLRARGFTVYPTAQYAIFVDQPTRPHEIRPVRRQALAFARSGGIVSRSGATVQTRFRYGGRETKTSAVIVRSVHHPGTRGTFFNDATRQAVRTPLAAMLQRSLQDAVRRSVDS